MKVGWQRHLVPMPQHPAVLLSSATTSRLLEVPEDTSSSLPLHMSKVFRWGNLPECMAIQVAPQCQ